MTITGLILVSAAVLIGFFAGLVIMALVIKSNNKRDDNRFEDMLKHYRLVEHRLSRYSDHAERTADALESISEKMQAK